MKKHEKSRKMENAEKNNASITNVHFSNYIETRWKDGKRRPISIRQNDKLYEAFKPIAKRLFGSVCRAIESFEAAVVTAAEQKVHFSNTGQPINIEKIVIERNLRPRRALELNEDVGPANECAEPCCDFCGKIPIVAAFRDVKSGIQKQACSYHSANLRKHHKWREVSGV